MVKKYFEFINESYGGFGTMGEYIEHLSKDNEYALNIISQYTQDFDPKIRLANVINLLPKSKQEFILKMILDEKSGEESPQDVDVISYTSVNLNESIETLGGKQILRSFLKVITALGQKTISYKPNLTPNDFIFYFDTELLKINDVKSVMSRYKFFDDSVNKIDYTFDFCNLYYGITDDLKFQYGIRTENELMKIGKFDLSTSVLKFLLLLDSPSANSLKKQISTLNINQLELIAKIKQSMIGFNPGSFEKKIKPVITDNVISYSYFDSNIDSNEIENIKSNFKSFLIPFRWSEKIQVNVSVTGNHLFFNIRLK